MAYALRIGLHVRAPRDVVFQHLLLPQHLARWFCNFAQVEPRPGGRFVFGGDYALTRAEGAAHACRFTGGVVRRSVVFAWPLFGAETSVTWEVEEAPDGSVLRVTHAGLRMLDGTSGSLHDTWRLCLGNLKAIAEGRGDSLRPDPEPPREPRIALNLLLDVPRQRAFGALVDAADVRRWAEPAREPHVEALPGGGFDLGFGEPGRIVAWEPWTRIEAHWPEGGHATHVSFRLEDKRGDRCGLSFAQEGFAPEGASEIVRLRCRWADRLVALKNVVEAGETGFTEGRDTQASAEHDVPDA